MNLNAMSVDTLVELRGQIASVLSEKVSEERQRLQAKLNALPAIGGKTVVFTPSRHILAGQKVAPKFQHPKTGETWAGRGLKPRWLTAELDKGKSLESFRIAS